MRSKQGCRAELQLAILEPSAVRGQVVDEAIDPGVRPAIMKEK